VLPLLADGGSVVLFSSVNELSGPAYAVAKAGIVGLARHLAKHQARRRIRANCLGPAPAATPMLDRLTDEELTAMRATIPLDHVTTADEIAETVGRLGSPAGNRRSTVVHRRGARTPTCPKWTRGHAGAGWPVRC
jgi:NAD(P)-dependent dehydrogenase (short-subunit alcohol dehydrogenase family)